MINITTQNELARLQWIAVPERDEDGTLDFLPMAEVSDKFAYYLRHQLGLDLEMEWHGLYEQEKISYDDYLFHRERVREVFGCGFGNYAKCRLNMSYINSEGFLTFTASACSRIHTIRLKVPANRTARQLRHAIKQVYGIIRGMQIPNNNTVYMSLVRERYMQLMHREGKLDVVELDFEQANNFSWMVESAILKFQKEG